MVDESPALRNRRGPPFPALPHAMYARAKAQLLQSDAQFINIYYIYCVLYIICTPIYNIYLYSDARLGCLRTPTRATTICKIHCAPVRRDYRRSNDRSFCSCACVSYPLCTRALHVPTSAAARGFVLRSLFTTYMIVRGQVRARAAMRMRAYRVVRYTSADHMGAPRLSGARGDQELGAHLHPLERAKRRVDRLIVTVSRWIGK